MAHMDPDEAHDKTLLLLQHIHSAGPASGTATGTDSPDTLDHANSHPPPQPQPLPLPQNNLQLPLQLPLPLQHLELQQPPLLHSSPPLSQPPPRDTPHHNHATAGVTPSAVTTPHDTPQNHDAAAAVTATASDHHTVAPLSTVLVPPLAQSNIPQHTSQSPSSTTLKAFHSLPEPNNSPTNSPALSSPRKSQIDGAKSSAISDEDKMLFGNKANLTQRRRSLATSSAVTEYEADLTSKDRAKQKAAVQRFLAERVKQDWQWEWPRNEPSEAPLEPPTESTDTCEGQWKQRDEWESNASEDGEDVARQPTLHLPESKDSPIQIESSNLVGGALAKRANDRRRRRKERLAEEMTWNDGVNCFVQRRDAWTCARHVSHRPDGFSRIHKVKSSASASEGEGSSTAIDDEASEYEEGWETDTEIPIAGPLLPPENAMRASITPAAYNTIYDKVIVQQLTPSCPMNLKDVTGSCVQGWKRDGEWPPRSSVPEPKKKQRTRSMSIASMLGLERHSAPEKPQGVESVTEKKDTEKSNQPVGGIRRSLQKILSLGQHGGHNEHENTKK